MMDFIMFRVFPVILILLIILLLVGLPIIIYADAHEPHIFLNKTEWSCSHSHPVTTLVLVGKVMVPMTQEICDTYRMNGY